jgi:hypothetical protein
MKRRPRLAMTMIVLAGLAMGVVAGSAAVEVPVGQDADSRRQVDAQAVECFLDLGFDIEGRLEFQVDEVAQALVFRPLVDDGKGNFSAPDALLPIEGSDSPSITKQDALTECVERLKTDLGLPAAPAEPQVSQMNDARATAIERCLTDAGVREDFETITLLESDDGQPIVEGTHRDMDVADADVLAAVVQKCILDGE